MTLFIPKWCLAPCAWISALIKFLVLQLPQPTSSFLLQEPFSHKPPPCSPALGSWGPGWCPVLSVVLPWLWHFGVFLIVCVNNSVKNTLLVWNFACTWDRVLKLFLEVNDLVRALNILNVFIPRVALLCQKIAPIYYSYIHIWGCQFF